MDLGDALVDVRRRAGLKQVDVARLLDVDQGLVSARERGKTRTPAPDLQRLAAATGVIIAATPLGWQVLDMPPGLPASTDHGPELQIPIGGHGAAGFGAPTGDPVTEYFQLRRDWLDHVDCLVRVSGRSMEPLLRDGDVVGAQRDQAYRAGDIVIAELGLERDLVVKIYGGEIEQHGLTVLHSANPDFLPLTLPDAEVDVVAVAYGAWRPGRLRVG